MERILVTCFLFFWTLSLQLFGFWSLVLGLIEIFALGKMFT